MTPAKRILTEFIYPPIPIRTFDWQAWFEGDEELSHYGYGRTEAEAIEDLKRWFSDDE